MPGLHADLHEGFSLAINKYLQLLSPSEAVLPAGKRVYSDQEIS